MILQKVEGLKGEGNFEKNGIGILAIMHSNGEGLQFLRICVKRG